MQGINTNGLYDTVGLIKSIIIDLDKLEVKGVANMKIIFDSIGKLNALLQNIEKRKEGEGNVSLTDGQRENIPG